MGYSSNANVSKDIIDLTDDTSVGDGLTNTQILQPPEGKFYRVKYITYLCPANTNAGTHRLYIKDKDQVDTSGNDYYCLIVSAHNEVIAIGRLAFTGSTSEDPSTVPEQAKIITDTLIATYDNPVYFIYKNQTGIANAQSRKLGVTVEVCNSNV